LPDMYYVNGLLIAHPNIPSKEMNIGFGLKTILRYMM